MRLLARYSRAYEDDSRGGTDILWRRVGTDVSKQRDTKPRSRQPTLCRPAFRARELKAEEVQTLRELAEFVAIELDGLGSHPSAKGSLSYS